MHADPVAGWAGETQKEMVMKQSLRMAALGFALLAWGVASLAFSNAGPDFAGFYEVSNPTDVDVDIRIRLATRVFNLSGADVVNATLTLQDTILPGKDYGSFQNVLIRDRENVVLSADFIITRREYERWQAGGSPSLRIEYRDAAGNAVRKRVELIQMPVGAE